MKETFWTTKQAVIQKLGKKEDAHVVASDSELDSKLEVKHHISRHGNILNKIVIIVLLIYMCFGCLKELSH